MYCAFNAAWRPAHVAGCMAAFAACTAISLAHAADAPHHHGAAHHHTHTTTSAPKPSVSAGERITVIGTSHVPATLRPAGQTTYSASRESFAGHVGQSVADMVVTIPGVSFVAGNGPRDVVVSVRGSGDRQAYGMKNIQVLEDGFPMTQPDGTARSDLIDPHAYDGVDVFQGPASTVFGNYAINGAINFRTRRGADIHGLEVGSDFGSFGMVNNYATLGLSGRKYDLVIFGSDVRGNGFIANSGYQTSTENLRLRVNLTSSDRLIVKFVNNITDTHLPVRLSLAQYTTNPFQSGCADASHAAAGCATVSLLSNGSYGARVATSPQAAGLGRFDRRTVAGVRWEHDINASTTVRTQFTYDQRHIDQPTSPYAYTGPYDSYAASSEVTNTAHPGRMTLNSSGGISFDDLDGLSNVYNVAPGGHARQGALTQSSWSHQWNAGLHFQEDLQFARAWHLVVGLGGTYSGLEAQETLLTNSASGSTRRLVAADRHFFNLAPEAALTYAPSRNWTLHTRVGTAYATPTTSNLFITPQGTYGNNTRLKSETSLGFDLGAEWHPSSTINIQVTGFYEFYRNELVSQSAGVNTVGAYTFNAPASQHRGVEVGATWTPLPRALSGARVMLSYTYDNQIYTRYTEVLSNSTMSRALDRSGNSIPGVIPHFLNARLLYDQPSGPLQGLGGYAEVTWRGDYWLDNANLLKAPGYALLNLELHYDPPARFGWIRHLHGFFEIQNVANQTYIAGATNITDVLASNGHNAGAAVLATRTGSIYAGSPRAFYGGVKVRF
ncbi:TonB-dependent receptor family protein [Novacetimonas hansenii]|uniref:TonB-dependent receptor n=1 Tax=Novacetimonas hansenii TaxID=436 RepID=A0AAW5ERE6_NOVHA|nr:TonB-dependent receptor [Novacetimonas hansenii]MCJ8353721.1 TonB-dependent receptor [Novacetimonas hansenii]